MKFSESWLRTLVNPSLDRSALAHALTMAGLEVEALEPVAPMFDRVVVGEVKAIVKHPQADRLKLLTVDVGQKSPLQIVCGADNVTLGMKAPCALVGATLPGGLEIKEAEVRGIASFGMMCSERELGLSQISGGLLVLAPDAPPGADLRRLLDLDDHLFTLKLTPNRADCLSVQGVAREVAAITNTPFAPLAVIPAPVTNVNKQREIRVQEDIACPRYLGRSLRLNHPDAPTPAWMAQRLIRSGLRPKSIIVDVTNYVLIELGQPLHAFDEDNLQGALSVRWARPGESLTLLNEQQVTLQPDMLVIADQSGPVALAGVMGGHATAVTPTSSRVFLESAFFSPEAIAGRARRLTLSSDSAYRFERGVDFSATRQALERATTLLLDLCGGGDAGAVVEVAGGHLPLRAPVRVRPERVRRVLGLDLSDEAMAQLLGRLGLTLKTVKGGFDVTSPSYRFDLAIEVDFIEEIARLYGYDQIPAVPPSGKLVMLPSLEARKAELDVALQMVHRGYQEVVTYSFVDAKDEMTLAAQPSDVALLNPIASQLSVMRSTLAVGLINSLQFNLSHKQERIRIFELGRCFSRNGSDYVQNKRLGGLIYGSRYPEQWGQPTESVDFFDLKMDIQALWSDATPIFAPGTHPALHPGRSAQIALEGQTVGWLGELHPGVTALYGFPNAPVLFEISLEALLERRIPSYQEPPRFQPVRRDIAVLVGQEVPAASILEALQAARVPGVSELALFDLYQGQGVADGKKSLAFRIVMQDTERTLTEAEIESGVAALLNVLQSQFSAQLR
ncbi:MAG: phenylalanine--tRNA ligase subunit beta [Betaproteobacteria bacterium]|nr:phenylalanine--tRNA ligase subunit beta [Betaproteobacteria bacterium]